MKDLNFDWLLSGSCLLSDVAMAYFTTCVYPRSAGRQMREQIERYPDLHAELLEAGYKRSNTLLTPRQICIVIQHWECPTRCTNGYANIRRIGSKNCSPIANSTDIC